MINRKMAFVFCAVTLTFLSNCSKKSGKSESNHEDKNDEIVVHGNMEADPNESGNDEAVIAAEVPTTDNPADAAAKAAAAANQAVSGTGQFPEIVETSFGGNGCPATGTPVKAVMNQANGLLTLEYGNLMANAADTSLSRLFCGFILSLKIPANKQLVVQSAEGGKLIGETNNAGSTSSIVGTYYFVGGPLFNFEPFQVQAGGVKPLSLPIKADIAKSGCGTSELFRINAVVNAKETGTVQVKTMGPFQFKLVACP